MSPRTRGIIPVHLFGLCADMDALAGLAGEHGLFVLEDAACALGSLYKGRRAGLLGDASCFSFHPRKVITTGEGGMICSERADILRTARSLRSHGCRPLAAEAPAWAMPEVPHLGYNYRMTDLQGALGCAQMAKLEDILAERARIADVYAGLLRGTSVMPPLTPADCRHSWQSYGALCGHGQPQRCSGSSDAGGRAVPPRHSRRTPPGLASCPHCRPVRYLPGRQPV